MTGETTRIIGEQIRMTGSSGGTESGTVAPVATLIESGAQVLANHGRITILSDSLEIAADSSVDSGLDGTVNIAPSSTGRKINIGSSSRKDTSLDLSQTILDRIITLNLNVGDEFAGTLSIVSDLNLTTAQNLTLKSAETILAEVGSVNLDGGHLTLIPGLNKAAPDFDQVFLGSGSYQDLNSFTLTVNGNLLSPDSTNAAFSVVGRLVLNGAALQLNQAADVAPGMSMLLISNDGTDPISGSFRNVDPSGQIVIDDITFQVSMIGGDGNDVTLTRETEIAGGDVWGTVTPDIFVVEPSAPSGSGKLIVSKSVAGQAPVYVGSISRDVPLKFHGFAGNDEVAIRGTSLDDLFVVNGSIIVLNGAAIIVSEIENLILVGNTGSDRYQICADVPTGNVRLEDISGNVDTLDFSTTMLSPVSLNLAELGPQAVNENMTLQLMSSSGIEHLLGGAKADVLYRNSLPNTITGNEGADRIVGGPGNDLLIGGDGSDALAGGSGNDTYLFTTASAAALRGMA